MGDGGRGQDGPVSTELDQRSLTGLLDDLRAQWDLLRRWLVELPEDVMQRPGPYPGWTVADVLAHLGRALHALTACRPAPADAEPLSLGDYLAGYTHDTPRTGVVARRLSTAIADRRLEALDELADQAFAAARRLVPRDGRDVVVTGVRGPILLSDMLVSRLAELVVHGEDLAPLLPLPSPVDPSARLLVAQALVDVLRRRTGASVDVGEPRAFVLLAAGRLTWLQSVAAGALLPTSLSDGIPDLSEALPIF